LHPPGCYKEKKEVSCWAGVFCCCDVQVLSGDSTWQEDDLGGARGLEQQRQQTFENPEVQQLMVSHFLGAVLNFVLQENEGECLEHYGMCRHVCEI
jgi:hypothetical protein